MADWRDWSEGWIKEGYYISYEKNRIRYYEQVINRDLAHYVYNWFETIGAKSESGPIVPEDLVITSTYNPETKINQIWQIIFGIKGQVYIYIQLPTDIHRHGLPKIPKPGAILREVSHFTEGMSPYNEPTFLTEHFLMKPDLDRIGLLAYNPNEQDITVKLNFYINKMQTERIGTVENGILTPTKEEWRETLDKLYRRLIPVRPISLYPVTGPAAD